MMAHNPVLITDKSNNTIVALQMMGPSQSVKANWAALMGGGKSHWLKSVKVTLEGSKSHITIKKALPCGWLEMWLIHKQASITAMSPTEPFYIIDDATAVPPDTFFPMINRSLSTPMLSPWATYLWLSGRQEDLITAEPTINSHGRACWTVYPNPEVWERIVTEGLSNGRITFTG